MNKKETNSFFGSSKRGLNLDVDDLFGEFPVNKSPTMPLNSSGLPDLSNFDTKVTKKEEIKKQEKKEDNPFSFFKVVSQNFCFMFN